jgi:hypothetical protein
MQDLIIYLYDFQIPNVNINRYRNGMEWSQLMLFSYRPPTTTCLNH